MQKAKEPNLILSLPEDLFSALKAIAREREVETADLIRSSIEDYLDIGKSNPPTVTFVVEQLKKVQSKFERQNVKHVSLIGISPGKSLWKCEINLLFELEQDCLVQRTPPVWVTAYNQFGRKYLVNSMFRGELSPEELDVILKDAIKIF